LRVTLYIYYILIKTSMKNNKNHPVGHAFNKDKFLKQRVLQIP
jgi:hypothetical protein